MYTCILLHYTDSLRGVEVFSETVLLVEGDKSQKLVWSGYGFYLEVPDGALPPGVVASVGIKVILAGQFTLPDNYQLISAIYWISSSEMFLKEVAVNIQHCATIKSDDDCSKFKFIIAKCSQKVLPYNFREREGVFNSHTQYATIKLKQFSLLGEVAPNGTEYSYTALKFYKQIAGTSNVDFMFVIVNNLEPCLKVHVHVITQIKLVDNHVEICSRVLKISIKIGSRTSPVKLFTSVTL